MLKLKFGAWAIICMMVAFTFNSCDDSEDNETTLTPPSRIAEALKQLYPGAQNVEWAMEGNYYVADCWVSGDELDVWFDANANWVMTVNERESIDQLVPAVYTAFRGNPTYNSWVVTDVYVLTYPQNPTESLILVKFGTVRHALYYSQEGGLLHDYDITDGGNTIWPPTL